jgi:hypothetical protein
MALDLYRFVAYITRACCRVFACVVVTWDGRKWGTVHYTVKRFWTDQFLAHLKGSCELLSPLSVRHLSVRLSVNFSHFNQLLWSHWANLNQTLVEWSLDGPLPKLCLVIPNSNQDGHQAKNRKKGGWNFNCPLLL